MLTSTAVDYGFKPYLVQIKHHKSNICCFSTRYIALRSKSKDWHGQCHDNYRLRAIHGLFHKLFKPIPPTATLTSVAKIVDVLDKGSGAVIIMDGMLYRILCVIINQD
jgi:hypothetical protein